MARAREKEKYRVFLYRHRNCFYQIDDEV
jgi:hypothetical protein